MKRRKTELKYKRERVVFSDVLPYEIPLIFSNRYFYRFLIKHNIRVSSDKIHWDNTMPDEAFSSFLFLFGFEDRNIKKETGSLNLKFKKIKIPFTYNIAHKPSSYRELAIVHPLNQVQMVEFYDTNKSLILHYCNQSNFSLRHPSKVASYFYYKDRLHKQLLGKKVDSKEEYMNEYENLKSFFSYKEYSNIYRFYEDYRYQRAEKKFDKLIRFDIQDCFNSIYTHSILWATQGGVDQGKHIWLNKRFEDTFGNRFDDLMQKMNYAETNGIVIGPEFSRIFAEIILQRIDKDVESYMSLKDKYHHREYECYRYVDDYFLFYNDEETKNEIMEQFSLRLREYKLTISESKTEKFEKPFITDITIAKQKIDALINEHIHIKYSESGIIENDEDEDKDTKAESQKDINKFDKEILLKILSQEKKLFISPNKFNALFKAVIKETSVEYKGILNYSLSIIYTRLNSLLKKFDKNYKYLTYYTTHYEELTDEERTLCCKLKNQYEKDITKFIVNLLDVVFFLYSNNKRINTTLKVTSILNIIILYFKNNYQLNDNKKLIRFEKSNIEMVFKKIQDEINLVMQTTPFNKHTQLEAFYLLLALKEMGNEYSLSIDTIINFLKIKGSKEEPIKFNPSDYIYWNWLLISVLLYYFSGIPEYKVLVELIEGVIKKKIEDIDMKQRPMSTELTILKMDILTYPYFSDEYKREILKLFGIDDPIKQEEILSYSKKQKTWFVKWKDFNLNYEISAKVSQEVYS